MALRDLFLIDPEITYLNHGSFGACPKVVFQVYQEWQRELERQPVATLGRRFSQLMAEARGKLAQFLGADADETVFFTNPTTAINMVTRSLIERQDQALLPGDEILTTDHEYGAMERTWKFLCRKKGIHYKRQSIPLPIKSHAEWVDHFWSGVTSRTRAIFISHITSPTALVHPVREICRRARQAGILSIIDGAHAPGQMPLDLHLIGADIYAGACHKWLMAPKGTGFVYVRKEQQNWLEPLVVSWGYESDNPGPSRYIDYHEWQGTRDISAFLSVPAAIKFQIDNDWDHVRRTCHQLACETRQRINEITGLDPICPIQAEQGGRYPEDRWFLQMFTAELPHSIDLEGSKLALYEQFSIEVPIYQWGGKKLMRVSIQGYNTHEDCEQLLSALARLL